MMLFDDYNRVALIVIVCNISALSEICGRAIRFASIRSSSVLYATLTAQAANKLAVNGRGAILMMATVIISRDIVDRDSAHDNFDSKLQRIGSHLAAHMIWRQRRLAVTMDTISECER